MPVITTVYRVFCMILSLTAWNSLAEKEYTLTLFPRTTFDEHVNATQQKIETLSTVTGLYVGKYCNKSCCKEVYIVKDPLGPAWECSKKCFDLRNVKRSPTEGQKVELLQVWMLDEIEWLSKNIQKTSSYECGYWLPLCYDNLGREDVNSETVTTSLNNFVRLGKNVTQTCPNCSPLSNITITMRPEMGNPTCLMMFTADKIVKLFGPYGAWDTDTDAGSIGRCICQVSQ